MNLYKAYRWLIPSLLFSICLTIVRVMYTGQKFFLWMNWNLFLAIMPLVISHYVKYTKNYRYKWILGVLWLLFFPNSIYIVTDLFHLKQRPDAPLWFDLILLFSTALNGVVLGLLSLSNIEQAITSKFRKRLLHVSTFCLLFLCGYGIYLGRYGRWNSWDILAQPYSLINNICYHLLHPLRNKEVWSLSFLFAIWLYLMYQYFNKLIKRIDNQ